jgi:hypothetical protein
MTEFTWNSSTSGDWYASADWDGGAVPNGAEANAVIAAAGSYAVQISGADTVTVGSLELNAAGATLDVAGMLVLGGTSDTFDLSGGTLLLDSGGMVSAGTIDATGGTLAAQGGTLSGVTYQGPLVLAGDQQTLMLQNGVVLQAGTGAAPGTIDLSGASNSGLYFLDNETLDNAMLNFGAGVADSLASGIGGDSGSTLTLGSLFTIEVSSGNSFLGYQSGTDAVNDSGDTLENAGLIAIGAGSLEVDYGTFGNAGSISIDGGTLQVDSTSFANAGTIGVVGGALLDLAAATLTTAQLSGIGAASGTVQIGGLLDNSGQTLAVGAGSALGAVLVSGTISGGVIQDGGAGMAFSGGTLDGVTYEGTIDLTAPQGSTLSIMDGVTLTDADGVGPGTIELGNISTLDIYGSQTLDNAFIDLQGGESGLNQYVSPGNQTATLTLGSNLTFQVDGGGDFLNNGPTVDGALVNDGTIQINSPAFLVQVTTLTNAGVINSGTGYIAITATTFTNLGAANLQNSALEFHVSAFSNPGTFDMANGGYTSVDTGSFDSSGTYDTGEALFVQATTVGIAGILNAGYSDYVSFMSDGAFTNTGSIDSAGYFGVQASDFTNTGMVVLAGDPAYLNISVSGSVSNSGTILSDNGEGGWIQATDVSNDGEIAESGVDYLDINASTLTNTATGTLSIADSAVLVVTVDTLDNEGLWSAGADSGNLVVSSSIFTNNGTIDAAAGSGEIVIYNGTIINNGTIASTPDGGILVLDPTVLTNTGMIVVGSIGYIDQQTFANLAGGTIDVDPGATLYSDTTGDWSNAGSIAIATGGTMYLSVGNTVLSADLAGISNDGTIFASITLDNTGQTLAIGSLTALGALELQGDTIIGGVVQNNGVPALLQDAVLAGVTYWGTLDLSAPNSSLTLTDDPSFLGADGVGPGTVNFDGGAFQSSYLYALGTETLDNVTIDIGNGGYGQNYLVNEDIDGTGAILTLGTNLVLDQVGNGAALVSSDQSGDGIINEGTILAGYGGGTFTIDATNFTNDGSISVSDGGFIYLTGDPTAALINSIDKSGGTVKIAGTVNGGTIEAQTGGIVSADGTLVGVTYVGTLDMSAANLSLTLAGAATFVASNGIGPGTVNFNGGAFQNSYLYALGTESLDNATIDIGNGGYGQNYLVNEDTDGTGAILTLGTNLILHQAGNVAALTSSDQSGDGIVNEGTILAGNAGGTFTIDATNFTNDGSIIVSSGGFINLTGAPTAALINSIAKSNGTVRIGGQVSGGTIYAPTGGVGGEGGTLAGVTYLGTLDLSAANSSLTLTGGNGFFGANGTGAATVNFNGGAFQNSYLNVIGTGTLDNATIDIGNGGYGQNYLVNEDTDGTGAILTLGTNLVLDQVGNGAALVSSDQSGDGIVNEGTILAGYGGGTFTIDATNLTNDGSIIVSSGGFINLTGSSTAALINSIAKSGGTVRIGGAVNGGTINAPTGGVGGEGGTLAGVTYLGTLDLSAANSSLTVTGGTRFFDANGTGAATINFNGGAFQNSYLNVLGTGTLDQATINIGNGGYGQNYLVNEDTAGSGAILTLGTQLVLAQVGNGAALISSDQSGDGIVNFGTILAGYAGGTFTIDATNFTNDGSIIVSNGGVINLTGAPTAALINSITKSNGTVRIGGTVNGGTIAAPTGGVGGDGGTLAGVTYQGTLDLSAANSSLTLAGGTGFFGATGSGAATINFNGGQFQTSYLYALGTETLDNATINIGNAGYGQNDLVNEDTAGSGAILTLGSHLTINQVGYTAALTSSNDAGDAIVNDGTIDAGRASGVLDISPSSLINAGLISVFNHDQVYLQGTSFTNNGSLSVASGATLGIQDSVFTNLSGGTLTGGIFEVDAGGTLMLPANAAVQSVAAVITLSGSNAAIETLVGGSEVQIDATLGTISPAGTLNLLSGRNFTTGSGFTDNGYLQIGSSSFTAAALTVGDSGVVVGSGTIVPAIANNGTIAAVGGLLRLDAAVTGSGALLIDPAAVLELSGASSEPVIFAPTVISAGTTIGGTLKLDSAVGYSGTIEGIALGDTIDLTNLIVSSATIAGGDTLIANISGGGSLAITLTGSFATHSLLVASDGAGGSDLAIAQVATVAFNSPGPIDFGNLRIGQSPSQALSVSNASSPGGPLLSAAFTGTTGAATGHGSVDQLVPGATDSTDLLAGLNAGTVGIHSDTVTVGFTSYLSASAAPIPDGSTAVAVQGTVYREAAYSLTAPVPMLVHVGDTVSAAVGVQNTDPNDGWSEDLIASIAGVSGTLAGGSGTIELAPGGGDATALSVALTTDQAGSFSGDAVVALQSDGTAIDGLGTAVLGTVDVPFSYVVDNYATAALVETGGDGSLVSGGGNMYTLDLGVIPGIGPDVITGLTLANVAVGPADTLNASISLTGDPDFMDTLANGGTVSVDGGGSVAFDTIDLPTANGGTFTETLTLTETDTNSSGFSQVLPTQTVVVTGTIVPVADPIVSNGPTIVLGDAHTGDVDQVSLSITNAGTGTASLAAGIGAIGGDAVGGGAIVGLAPGATDSSSITAGLDTSQDGARSGTVSLQFLSGDSTVAVGGGNLVVNGGFENGDAGWIDGNAVVAAGQNGIPAHSGNQFLEFGAVGSDAYTSQTLATQAGTEYAIRLWYWSSGQAPDDLNVSFGSDTILSLVNPPQAGWTEYTEYDTASSDSTVLTIGARNDPAYDAVDDVSVVAVGATNGVVLPGQTVAVQGNVFNEAAPTVTGPGTLFLHVGDGGGLYTGTLTVANNAPADAYSEALDASVTGVSEGAITAGGTVSGLAAGASDSLSLTFSAPTDFAGTFSNEIFVDSVSDGTGIDSLGTTDLGSQGIPVTVSVLNYATATIQTAGIGGAPTGTLGGIGNAYTLDLGQIEAGSVDALTGLVLANTAIGPADTLNAVISLIGDAAFADSLANSGTIDLQAGQALTFDTIDLSAGSLGTFTETLTLTETDTNNGGFSEVLPTQTVVVTGTVVLGDVANPVINNGPTIVLPDVHVGSTDQTALSITNAATGTATLVAGVNLLSGDATGVGYIAGLAPGATDDSSIEVGLNTARAGAQSGTVSLQLVSNGTFIAGGGGFNLVDNGGFENGTAGWSGSNGASGSGAFGIAAHSGNEFLSLGAVGGDAYTTQTLATQVGAEYQISLWYWASGNYPDDLNVYFGSDHLLSLSDPARAGWTEYTANVIATSASTDLKIGAFNNPSWDGVDDVSVVATGTSAAGSVLLPTQTVAVEGNVYREAAPSIGAPYYVYLHVGDDGGTYTAPLTVANTAAADGYSEGLEATVTGVSYGSATAGGTTGDITAGQSDATSLTVSQSTTNAGAYYSNVAVAETSDGTGVDGLGITNLGTATVGVYVLVDNDATAAVEQANNATVLTGPTNVATIDLGTFQPNSGTVYDTLAIANFASGQADYLTGSISASGDAAFSDTGLGAFGPVGAGSTSQFTVDLSTVNNGVFMQQIVVSATGANNSGYAQALAGQTIVVTGTVGVATDTAVPVINTPTVIALPDIHVGGTANPAELQAVSITNAGSAGLYVLPNPPTGHAVARGSIQDLAPGGTDASDIAVGIDDSTAGSKSGSVTLSLVSVASGSAGGSGGAIVNNGDFENGNTGWSFSNAGIAGSGFAGMPAEQGNNLLYLSGGSGSATQVLNSVAGHSYQIQFWYDSTGVNPNTLGVSFGGAPVVTVADAPASGWQEYTVTAPAVSNNTTLTFSGGSSGWYDGIDNVSVTDLGAGDVALPSQTISVSGNVYRLAAPSVALPAGPIVLHVGDGGGTVSVPISVANGAPADGYSEGLDASVVGASSGAIPLSTLNEVGSARMAGSELQLTDSSGQAGAGWLAAPIPAGQSFDTTFSFSLTNIGTSPQADGLAFVIQGAGNNVVGGTGGALGLSGLPGNSAAIVFQSWLNNHAGIVLNSDPFSAPRSLPLGNAQTVTGIADLAYDATTHALTLTSTETLDGVNYPVDQTVSVDLSSWIGQNLYLGFTAGTGGADSNQEITGWNVTSAGASSGGSSLIGASGSTGDIAAGQTSTTELSASISTATAGSEIGAVQVAETSDGMGVDSLGLTNLGTVAVGVQATVMNYATAAIMQAGGAGTLQGSGSAYSIDLGEVALGSAPVSLQLAVENAAQGPADLLEGGFGSASGDAAIQVSTGTFSALGAGASAAVLSATLQTNAAGRFSEQVVLTATGYNASGYSGILTPETITVTGTVAALAHAALTTPGTIDFGRVHANSGQTAAIGITNLAVPPADSLSATATTSGAATASGAIAGLAAGASDSGSIVGGLATGSTGVVNGDIALSFVSNGVNGQVALTNQGTDVAVTGTVYALAEPFVTGTTLDFGAVRVGEAVTAQAVTIANGTTATPYQETLDYSLDNPLPAGFIAVGSLSGTAVAGGTAHATVTLDTSASGDFSDATDPLTLTSDGGGSSGLGVTALDSDTITFSGKVYASAVAQFAAALDFGIVHAGATDIKTLSVTNTATGALTDVLTGGTGLISGGGFTGSGALGSGLAAGASSSALSFALNTGTSGAFNAIVTLGLASHDADQADVPVSASPIALSGTVYNYATVGVTDANVGTLTGSGNAYALNLGTLTQGATLSTAVVSLANIAAGLADMLSGTVAVSGGTSAFVNSGFGPVGTLAAGQASNPIDISLHTGTAGAFSETLTFTPVSTDPGGSTSLAPITITVAGSVVGGAVYNLTTGADTINGNSAANTIVATGSALSAGDNINAGSGPSNLLSLKGAGTFDLSQPAVLTGIATVWAQEGQPSAVVNGVTLASTLQTVTLRAAQNNVTVNVQAATPNPSNPAPTAITINGAANNDVINLGYGNDTVTPGVGETVNGGSGNATVMVTAATISDAIHGGSHTTKLWFTGGGTFALGANLTNLTSVYLAPASTAWNITATTTAGLVLQDASTATNDHLTANGAVQVLTGGGAGKLTMTGAFDTVFQDTAALFNGDTLGFAAGDVIDLTNLLPSGLTVTFAENAQNTGGTLAVLSGGIQKTAVIMTGGVFSQSHFSVASDGGTGSAIGYHA